MAAQRGNDAWLGKGETIEAAVQKAWDKARKRRGQGTTFDLVRISVHGRNPISGYSVILVPPSK